jgi:Uma2 family endonuclease
MKPIQNILNCYAPTSVWETLFREGYNGDFGARYSQLLTLNNREAVDNFASSARTLSCVQLISREVVMVQYNPLQYLPTAEELPDSDDTPVDNELQILVASLLGAILAWVWRTRTDWFWGTNMGVYYDPNEPAIVPDGFLSLEVERLKSAGGRLSYVLWEENNVVPLLAIEVVSKTYGKEYDEKQTKYAQIGVLYYVVYNPDYWERDKHNPFEVYRLENGVYVRQEDEPVWIVEIGLGIGRGRGTYRAWTREWLYWYDQERNRLPSPDERTERAEQRAEQERQRAEQERRLREELIARLRERGIDLDAL